MPPATASAEDPERRARFEARVAAEDKIEPNDWMPEAYRRTLTRQISQHAHSEIVGMLPAGNWSTRAPSLRRTAALLAKAQAEGRPRLHLTAPAELAGPSAAAATYATGTRRPAAGGRRGGSGNKGRRAREVGNLQVERRKGGSGMGGLAAALVRPGIQRARRRRLDGGGHMCQRQANPHAPAGHATCGYPYDQTRHQASGYPCPEAPDLKVSALSLTTARVDPVQPGCSPCRQRRGALISFCFNVGVGALETSSLRSSPVGGSAPLQTVRGIRESTDHGQ